MARPSYTNTDIKPYTIAIPDSKIQRLKQKLSVFDLPDEVPGVEPWSRGPPLADIKRLAAYWRDGYDWRAAEARLNSLPNFMTQIEVEGYDTYDVHFVHQQSQVQNAIPLLFVHGWPGSFIEVTKILPLLSDGGKGEYPAFHVVAPSLVDFGFSSPSLKPRFNMDQHAEVCHKLMQQLGYTEYVVQGGDIGYPISRLLALNYPSHCKAHHINLAVPSEPSQPQDSHSTTPHAQEPNQTDSVSDTDELSAWEQSGLARTAWFNTEGRGYNLLQQTRPQTIGYAIAANPVALLAWIYEKLHDWSDGYAWTDDEILTWISIYEFSTAGAWASQRIYYDDMHRNPCSSFVTAMQYIDVKLGISRFPKELVLSPRKWHYSMGPVVLLNEHDRGGHFAAWEVPEVLVGDTRQMLGRGGGAFGCVSGKSGYED